ncbi:MAG: hypothetical protein ACTSU5_20725 [Promethearchaeota archaeon]
MERGRGPYDSSSTGEPASQTPGRCEHATGTCEQALRDEEAVQERVNGDGVKWRKVYFGTGAHFENWLAQCREIYGEENIEVEETKVEGLACFGAEGTQMKRIWVKAERGCRGA